MKETASKEWISLNIRRMDQCRAMGVMGVVPVSQEGYARMWRAWGGLERLAATTS